MRSGWPASNLVAPAQTRSRPAPRRMAIPRAASEARAECKDFAHCQDERGIFNRFLRATPSRPEQRTLSGYSNRCQRRYDLIALRAGIAVAHDGFLCPFCPTRHERGSRVLLGRPASEADRPRCPSGPDERPRSVSTRSCR